MSSTSKKLQPAKPVNEVYESKSNSNKFCMPLGLNSARELEDTLQKEKEDRLELIMKKNNRQK